MAKVLFGVSFDEKDFVEIEQLENDLRFCQDEPEIVEAMWLIRTGFAPATESDVTLIRSYLDSLPK